MKLLGVHVMGEQATRGRSHRDDGHVRGRHGRRVRRGMLQPPLTRAGSASPPPSTQCFMRRVPAALRHRARLHELWAGSGPRALARHQDLRGLRLCPEPHAGHERWWVVLGVPKFSGCSDSTYGPKAGSSSPSSTNPASKQAVNRAPSGRWKSRCDAGCPTKPTPGRGARCKVAGDPDRVLRPESGDLFHLLVHERGPWELARPAGYTLGDRRGQSRP